LKGGVMIRIIIISAIAYLVCIYINAGIGVVRLNWKDYFIAGYRDCRRDRKSWYRLVITVQIIMMLVGWLPAIVALIGWMLFNALTGKAYAYEI